jgi:hypothetical protein
MLTRSGTAKLPAHLEASYGIQVVRASELDLGVFRTERGHPPPPTCVSHPWAPAAAELS